MKNPAFASFELDQLQKYDFVGPHIDPNMAETHTAHLLSQRLEGLPESPSLSPERLEIIQAVDSAIIDYTRELGFDISGRLPSPNLVHVYDRYSFKAIAKAFDNGTNCNAYTDDTNGEIVMSAPAEDDPGANYIFAPTLGHERIHSAARNSKRQIGISNPFEPSFRTMRSGYALYDYTGSENGEPTDYTFTAFNEYAVEKINLTIQERYWPKYAILNPYIGKAPGYVHDMPVGDALIDVISRNTGQRPEDVVDNLARGEFTKDISVLRDITSVIGHEGVRLLVNYGVSHTHQQAGKIATQLGLQLE